MSEVVIIISQLLILFILVFFLAIVLMYHSWLSFRCTRYLLQVAMGADRLTLNIITDTEVIILLAD